MVHVSVYLQSFHRLIARIKKEAVMLHRVEEDQILTMGKEPASQDDEQCSGKAEIDHTDRWSRLRASYCKMLEEYLDNLGLRSHWGKTLKQKMKKFSSEATVVLEEWAIFHGIELAKNADNDEDDLTIRLIEYSNDEYRKLAGERLYDNSPYGILLRTLDKL